MQDIKYMSNLLRQGNIVAIPTETVYGLGADATNIDAVKKIFELKKRPADNPLIIHVGNKSQILEYAHISNDIEQKIIDKLMPGPISILLKKKKNIPDIVTAGSDLVAVRIPDHGVCISLLEEFGGAIAAPSANISGAPSPTSSEMVYHNFDDKVEILDGGNCHVGIESTVIQVFGNQILIHRPGFITIDDISSLFPDLNVKYSNTQENISPGVKYKHYCPKAKIEILKVKKFHKVSMYHKIMMKKIGVLATQEFIEKNKEILKGIKFYNRGSRKDIIQCAKNLYKYYHQADKDGLDFLYVEELEEVGIGYAIMNRVRKSLGK